MPNTLTGRSAATGSGVRVEFDRTIGQVHDAFEAGDVYIAPGWVDLQVNGFAGVDYNSPRTSHEDIARSIDVLVSTGVTRFYPTVITGGPDDMRGALRNLARAKEELRGGIVIEGFHVEGPHISPDDGPRGAHPRAWVRPPDVEEFRRWQDATNGLIRLVTLAPEWPAATKYIETLTASGVVVSIGHTAATAEQLADAVSAGATMSTHLGNGAHPIMQRHPNYIWEQLADDRLTASFIVDGIHLPASFLKTALRAKGLSRSVLVTDASTPAGAAPGRYALGEQALDLTNDGRVVLAGTDRLAGSALRMDHGVRNLMTIAGLTLPDAVAMATTGPARVARIQGRQAGLDVGERADFVVFRFDERTNAINVEATFVGGERMYHR